METVLLPVAKLRRRPDARKVRTEAVAALVESIREIGIINPLRVRPSVVFESGRETEGWEITAGRHRFEAATRLGMTEVPCVVVDDDTLHAELAMIDENLCRAELSDAERAAQIHRRKEIYEEIHPAAKHGGVRGDEQVANFATRFTKETAAATGRSERAVQLDATRAKKLGLDTLEAVQGTSLDKGVELDALAKLEPEQRRAVVDAARSGKAVSARDQSEGRADKIDSDVKSRAAREVAEMIAEHVPGGAWDALKANLYAAGANNIANAFTNITGQSVMGREWS